MLHRFRFVILGTLMVVASAAASYAVVSAYVPNALLPAGTTRYAAVSDSTPYSLSYTGGYQDLQGMTKYITIPTGQTADVFVYFCSQFRKSTGTYVNIVGMLRTTLGDPVAPQFVLTADPTTQCTNFYWTNVTAGQPPIKVKMYVPTSTTVVVDKAAMLVTVNLH